MSSLLSLLAGLWAHVGPGIFLALALPVSLALLAVLVRASWMRRTGS